MKAAKRIAILFLVYIGIVAVFESLIGYFQPGGESTLVLITADEDGTPHARVLSRIDSAGQLYVAANHWPRAWYERALQNPKVQVEIDSKIRNYLAVPPSPEDHDRVDGENSLPIFFRLLSGFPPRYFLRLEPH